MLDGLVDAHNRLKAGAGGRAHEDARFLAGCTGVFVGFESLSDANLSDARNRTPRTDDYARRARLLHDNGIQVNGSFVLGFDHARPDVFARTTDWRAVPPYLAMSYLYKRSNRLWHLLIRHQLTRLSKNPKHRRKSLDSGPETRARPLFSRVFRQSVTAAVWHPLVEWTRRRHVRFRQRLAGTSQPEGPQGAEVAVSRRAGVVVAAGV